MASKILKKQNVAPEIFRMEVSAAQIAKKHRAGQFVILRIGARGERIPLTVVDKDLSAGSLTLIFQVVGKTTMWLSDLKEGDEITDLVGPLGNPTEVENFGNAVAVGGGVGVACVYPIAKALKEAGNHLTSIIGARTKDHLILEPEMAAISDRLEICTDDGSKGIHGFVSEVLKRMIERKDKIDYVIAVGPVPMMRAIAELTRGPAIKTIVSLNSIMVDGTGMCGSCRVLVGGERKFACVDGPEFDGHQVDFQNMTARLRVYKEQEDLAREKYQEERKK